MRCFFMVILQLLYSCFIVMGGDMQALVGANLRVCPWQEEQRAMSSPRSAE